MRCIYAPTFDSQPPPTRDVTIVSKTPSVHLLLPMMCGISIPREYVIEDHNAPTKSNSHLHQHRTRHYSRRMPSSGLLQGTMQLLSQVHLQKMECRVR